MNKLGYCCINLSNPDLQVSRTMRKKTYSDKGMEYVSELVIQNLTDLEKILQWNVKNDIFVYRLSSEMFPWFSEYNIWDLPNYYDTIKPILKRIGEYILNNNIRVSFHPGPFNVLNSLNQAVVDKTFHELSQHAVIMDEMMLPNTRQFPINIHVNNSKPDKNTALNRFIEAILKHRAYRFIDRLVVENDDKGSMFCIKDLYEVYKATGIAITFDNLHYWCSNPNASLQQYKEAMEMAFTTWGGIRPLMHWSSSKRHHEDPTAKVTAHSDYIYDKIDTFNYSVDIEIEAKKKDLAVIKYKQEFPHEK